jgi:hypothetical protein
VWIYTDNLTGAGTITAPGGAAGLQGASGGFGAATDGGAGGTGNVVKYNRLSGLFF